MNYVIAEKNGVYTAVVPLALRDGRKLMIRGSASIADTYRELGLDPRIHFLAEQSEVGGFPGSLFKSIGKAVKKITKSKALRKVVGVAKSVLKSPITTVALGAVTGGSALPALAAANVAVRVAESAAKGGKKGQAARKLLKAAKRSSDKQKIKLRKANIVKQKLVASGKLNPQSLADLQMRALRNKIRKAKAMKRLPTKARAADWLVNVHLA